MSDEAAEAPAPQDAVRWWNEGEWRPVPSGMLSADTSSVTIAINDTEYPALSELIRYADNVDGYLRMLGVSESSISGQDNSSMEFAEDEETMGMGE